MPPRDTDYDTDQAADYAAGQRERVQVPEAAERLGITENALRRRVQRNTVDWARDSDGWVFVYLPPTMPPTRSSGHAELSKSLKDQVDYLRGVLETRDRELSEMRRLLAGALERIPELEPARESSSEPQRAPVSRSDTDSNGDATQEQEERREKSSWWRRLFEL